MSKKDPFAFVEEALGVSVAHRADGPQGPGYYLEAPEPEWLGASFVAAMKRARATVTESEPDEPFDWIGAARSVVSLVDLMLPPAGGALAPAAATYVEPDDGDDLP